MSNIRKYLTILNESDINDDNEHEEESTDSCNESAEIDDDTVDSEDPEPSEEELFKDAAEKSDRDWARYFDETVQRMKHLSGIQVNEKTEKLDFLDADKDGDKTEPMKDAIKDSNKKDIDEELHRLLTLSGISEDSIYPNADHMEKDRHPNDEGSDGCCPDQKFGEDEIYDGEGPTAPHHRTSHPGRYCELKAPMSESANSDEEDIDEDSFSYKMARAAKAGKKEVEIDGKIFKVKMSKDKAEKIAK